MIHSIVCQRNNPTNSQPRAAFRTYLASFRSPHHDLRGLNLCSSWKWSKFLWLFYRLIWDYCMLSRLKLEMISDWVINHWDTFIIPNSSNHRLIVSVQSKINITLILCNNRRSTWDNNFRCLCDSNRSVIVLSYKLLNASWIGVLVRLLVKCIIASVKIDHHWGVSSVIHWFIVHHSCNHAFFHLVFSSRWVHSTLLPLDFFEPLIRSPVDSDVSFEHLDLPRFQALNLTIFPIILWLPRAICSILNYFSRCSLSTQLIHMSNWIRISFRLDSI